MSFFHDGAYDRAKLLDAAARARRRKRPHDAIACYERVLKAEPENPDLLRRIAPLFAQVDEPDRAWQAYRTAADEFARQGFADKAIGVYREAAAQMPRTATGKIQHRALRARLLEATAAIA